MKGLNKIGILVLFMLVLSLNVFAYNDFEGEVNRWALNDSNYDGLVNETDGIIDYKGINNGTLYGKTFNHGTNNGATLSTYTEDNMTKFGGYYEFDGVDDYVSDNEVINFSFINNTGLTVCTQSYKNVGFGEHGGLQVVESG